MTNGRRRRLSIILLMFCLLLIAFVLAQIWYQLRQDKAIVYRDRNIQATPAELCPGEAFTFPVSIDINQPESVSRITEGWCRVKDGVCPRILQNDPYYVNFVEPYSVQATASRTVSSELAPGEWQLRHCNTTEFSGGHDVTCYAVQITVKDCAGP